MNGKIAVIVLIVAPILVGGGIWYAQEYGYYERIEPGSPDAEITLDIRKNAVLDIRKSGLLKLSLLKFDGINATSSPIRWRACFLILPGLDIMMLGAGTPYENPTPLIGPGWFDCFDAARIGADLESGAAKAFLSQAEIYPDVDRVLAVYPDGHGYGWHQYNDKTPERGVMD